MAKYNIVPALVCGFLELIGRQLTFTDFRVLWLSILDPVSIFTGSGIHQLYCFEILVYLFLISTCPNSCFLQMSAWCPQGLLWGGGPGAISGRPGADGEGLAG